MGREFYRARWQLLAVLTSVSFSCNNMVRVEP